MNVPIIPSSTHPTNDFFTMGVVKETHLDRKQAIAIATAGNGSADE
jgi:hypothetical protein